MQADRLHVWVVVHRVGGSVISHDVHGRNEDEARNNVRRVLDRKGLGTAVFVSARSGAVVESTAKRGAASKPVRTSSPSNPSQAIATEGHAAGPKSSTRAKRSPRKPPKAEKAAAKPANKKPTRKRAKKGAAKRASKREAKPASKTTEKAAARSTRKRAKKAATKTTEKAAAKPTRKRAKKGERAASGPVPAHAAERTNCIHCVDAHSRSQHASHGRGAHARTHAGQDALARALARPVGEKLSPSERKAFLAVPTERHVAAAHAPVTQRAMQSGTPSRAGTMIGLGAIDDATALRELKAASQRESPGSAEDDFAVIERIWRAGGGAATRAWMQAQGITGVVEAWKGWLAANQDQARRLLQAS